MDGNGDDQFWTAAAEHGGEAGGGVPRRAVVSHPPPVAPPGGGGGFNPASFDVLAAAFAAMPDGFGVLERVAPAPGVVDFIWTQANPALRRLIGDDALIGRYVERDHADGASGRAIIKLLGLASAAPAPREQIVSMTGGYRRVTAQGFGFAPDGGPAGYVSITVSDFAASRGADPLRIALEHSRDAVALFDSAGRLVDATGRLKEMFPEIAGMLAPGALMEGLLAEYHAVAIADKEGGDAASWMARRMSRHRRDGGETTFHSPDGRWLRNSEWRTPDGGLICIYTDVTAFKEQEERLRDSEAAALAAKREAEKASRAKSEFLTHMSHELRTPLNAIIGFAELLKMETLGPLGNHRYLNYARDILDSGRRLLELVDDALNLSHIDAGRINLVEEMINIGGEIAAVTARTDAEARERGVALSTDAAENLPLLVADRRAVRQMIEHLLSNALKFTPAAGAVMISATSTPDGGLGVMVADTGVGIAEEDLERVVRPFGRTEMSVAHCIDGTGLGLPLVKRLIELHGGRLDLDSVVGVGTTAILMFPAERMIQPQALPTPMRVVSGG